MAAPSRDVTSVFPVEWSSLTVDGPPYEFDAMHAPFPIPPLSSSMYGEGSDDAFVTGLRRLGIPVRASERVYVNHFQYSRLLLEPITPELAQDIEVALRDAIAAQMERWLGDYLPRTLELVAALRAIDISSTPIPDIPAMMDHARALDDELWTIHFELVFPMVVSIQLFSELYQDLFEATDADAQELLRGGLSESVKMGLALSDLADDARELGVDELIVGAPDGSVLGALAARPNGEAFRSRLDAFLDRYGYNQDLYLPTMPTWVERPELALANVRQYLRTGFDARSSHEAVAREAEEQADRARARLAGYPQPVREQFEAMLVFARQGAFLHEEHNFHIDQHSAALSRLFYVAVGRRLVEAGVIDAPDDVFMLEEPEVQSLLANPDVRQRGQETRALVRERQREMAVAAALTPPPLLGDASAMAEIPDNPMTRAMGNFFGGSPPESEVEGDLRGYPASRGTVTAQARVALSLGDAQALKPGEVLVAMTTMPPWTPLFGVAAAVVTETGGPLSHCATVAREYGIPAVVGARGATTAIRTGMTVTVDGATGTVTIGR